MTRRKAPANAAITRSLGALFIFALGASVSPALAATGADASCDQSAESPPLPEPTTDALSLEVVEHAVSDHDVPGRMSVDGSAEAGGSGLDSSSEPPRVETLLRRIFDETQIRTPGLPESEDVKERNAPMATDNPESADSASAEFGDAQDAAPGPRLPGISSDELLRFKRQMYRTDI